MQPLKWIWLRHARPLVEKGYIYGAEETVPLNLTGPKTIAAFKAIAGILPENLHIECSASPRAQTSLEHILSYRDDSPDIHLNDRFMEQSFGDWTGKFQKDIPPQETADYRRDLDHFGPPGGESGNVFKARVSDEIDRINQSYKNGGISASTILVSGHGGVTRAALAKAWNIPFSRATAQPVRRLSVTEIQWNPEDTQRPWNIISINRTLSPDRS